jgi:endonuclease YncB( thermonuclease family)
VKRIDVARTSHEIPKGLMEISLRDVPTVPCKGVRTPCRVAKVYDGDTCTIVMILDGGTPFKISVRLNGIDAPEMRSKSELERSAAIAVRDRLAEMVTDRIVWVYIMAWDKYGGRVRGEIYVGERDIESVSGILMAEGLVKEYHGAKREEWRDEELEAIIANAKILSS